MTPLRPRIVVRERLCASRPASSPPSSSSSSPASPTRATRPASQAPEVAPTMPVSSPKPTRTTFRATAISSATEVRGVVSLTCRAFASPNAQMGRPAKTLRLLVQIRTARPLVAVLQSATVGSALCTVTKRGHAQTDTFVLRTLRVNSPTEVGASW